MWKIIWLSKYLSNFYERKMRLSLSAFIDHGSLLCSYTMVYLSVSFAKCDFGSPILPAPYSASDSFLHVCSSSTLPTHPVGPVFALAVCGNGYW